MNEPVQRQEDMRVSDTERQAVIDRLQLAHGEGRLDLNEFDMRAARVWQAKTYGELAEITVDLPAPPQPPRPKARAPEVSRRRAELRAATVGWLAVSALNLVAWVVVSVAAGGGVYPWWIWVAGPWGVMLLMRWCAGGHAAPGCRPAASR